MKLQFTRIIMILIFLAVLLPTVTAEESGSFPSDDQWFAIAVEQHGMPVAVRNNRAEIERAPFTLVLIMRGPMGVLANFSESPQLFKGFLKNKPLSSFIDQPDTFMGMGEADRNPHEMIVIDELSAHYLFYTDGASNRFSSTQQLDEYIIGRRVISNFTTFEDDFAPSPIQNLLTDTLYMSFLYGEWDEDYNRLELQKEALKLTFK